MGELASRKRRLVANILDGIIVGIVMAILSFIFGLGSNTSFTSAFEEVSPFFSFISLVLVLIFSTIIPIYVWNGQTIGKRILGIVVVKLNDEEVDLQTLLIRNIFIILGAVKIPFFTYLINLIQFIDALSIFKSDKRMIHDLMANTKVVRA